MDHVHSRRPERHGLRMETLRQSGGVDVSGDGDGVGSGALGQPPPSAL